MPSKWNLSCIAVRICWVYLSSSQSTSLITATIRNSTAVAVMLLFGEAHTRSIRFKEET